MFKIEITIACNGRFCGECTHRVDDFCGIWSKDREYEEIGDTNEFDYVRVEDCFKAEKEAKIGTSN